jgi:cytoskeletal protein RodZ
MEELNLPPVQEEVKEELSQVTPSEKPNFLERFWYLFLLIAVAALIAVGLLWASNQGYFAPKATPTPTPAPIASPAPEEDQETESLNQQGSSDEIDSIESDLNNTNLNNLDKELTNIESELNAP